jgi:hypothetical protein
MNWLHDYKAYITGAFVALVAFNSVTGVIPQEVLTVILAIGAALGYYTGQTPGSPPPTGASGSRPNMRLFGLVLLGLVLVPAIAEAQTFAPAHPACLPWRRQIEQRLQQQHQPAPQQQAPQTDPAMLSLLQQIAQNQQALMGMLAKQQGTPAPSAPSPAPAAPMFYMLAPQGGLTPPLQNIPLGGMPLQVIPLGGMPLQNIPLGGQPLQNIPLGGQPMQVIPLGGPPLQQLGNPQAPQQQVPLGQQPLQQLAPPVPLAPMQQIPLGPAPQQQITPPAGSLKPAAPAAPAVPPVMQPASPSSSPPPVAYQRYTSWQPAVARPTAVTHGNAK